METKKKGPTNDNLGREPPQKRDEGVDHTRTQPDRTTTLCGALTNRANGLPVEKTSSTVPTDCQLQVNSNGNKAHHSKNPIMTATATATSSTIPLLPRRMSTWLVLLFGLGCLISLLGNPAITNMPMRVTEKPNQHNNYSCNNGNNMDTTTAPDWSDVITTSTEYFWGNNKNITFVTKLAMDTRIGRLSVRATFDDPTKKCPHPSFRARLSGVAMVHIPMDTVSVQSTTYTVSVSGSVWIPVPGEYFLEVLLLHCTIDSSNLNMTSAEIRQGCPLTPVIDSNVKDYSFTVASFLRPQRMVEDWITNDPSVFPYSAWVFAPRCPHSIYDVSAHCTAISQNRPHMIRTRVQLMNYLNFMNLNSNLKRTSGRVEIQNRFDDYVFLPVNRSDGSILYDTDHAVHTYVPPVEGLSSASFGKDKKLCFVGDSFARYLWYEAMHIIANTTFNTGVCQNQHQIRNGRNNHTWEPHIFVLTRFGSNFIGLEDTLTARLSQCTAVFCTFGRWDASYKRGNVTAPFDYKKSVLEVLASLETVTGPSTKTYFLSSAPMSLGSAVLGCTDWRVDPVMAAYNGALVQETGPTDQDGLRPFKSLSRSYFVDNTHMEAPLWDDPADWTHPCRHVFRPLDRRLLLLAARDMGIPVKWS